MRLFCSTKFCLLHCRSFFFFHGVFLCGNFFLLWSFLWCFFVTDFFATFATAGAAGVASLVAGSAAKAIPAKATATKAATIVETIFFILYFLLRDVLYILSSSLYAKDGISFNILILKEILWVLILCGIYSNRKSASFYLICGML